MGMRVMGFEGSWLAHPFWRCNFVIEDEATLRKVRESKVTGVVIEAQAEQPSARARPPASAPPRPAAAKPSPQMPPISRLSAPEPAPPSHQHDEVERAKAVLKRARAVMARVFEQARLGRSVRASEVSALVDEISEAVMRNPGAMVNVARLKTKTEYTYMHSVAVCTLMVNFARTLGLPEESHRAIGLAGLLHDVGKVTIPEEILDKPGRLTEAEYELIKMHTLNGRDLIAGSTDMPEVAIDVCTHHHERMDGTGYPFGHHAGQLTLHARMGAICDVYDALTSDRIYKAGWLPQETLTQMHGWQGHFDPELFFEFLKSVQIFPAGMLVELRSQRVGIILPPTRRNARPRARAFYDLRTRSFIAPEDVPLGESLRHDLPLREVDPVRLAFPHWERARGLLLDNKDPRPVLDLAA
jgi:putative nucleotidyltransferase with HDIG domain